MSGPGVRGTARGGMQLTSCVPYLCAHHLPVHAAQRFCCELHPYCAWDVGMELVVCKSELLSWLQGCRFTGRTVLAAHRGALS